MAKARLPNALGLTMASLASHSLGYFAQVLRNTQWIYHLTRALGSTLNCSPRSLSGRIGARARCRLAILRKKNGRTWRRFTARMLSECLEQGVVRPDPLRYKNFIPIYVTLRGQLVGFDLEREVCVKRALESPQNERVRSVIRSAAYSYAPFEDVEKLSNLAGAGSDTWSLDLVLMFEDRALTDSSLEYVFDILRWIDVLVRYHVDMSRALSLDNIRVGFLGEPEFISVEDITLEQSQDKLRTVTKVAVATRRLIRQISVLLPLGQGPVLASAIREHYRKQNAAARCGS